MPLSSNKNQGGPRPFFTKGQQTNTTSNAADTRGFHRGVFLISLLDHTPIIPHVPQCSNFSGEGQRRPTTYTFTPAWPQWTEQPWFILPFCLELNKTDPACLHMNQSFISVSLGSQFKIVILNMRF